VAEGRTEGLAEGRAEGVAEGRTEGMAEGLRHAVEDLCELLGIELSQTHSDLLASATVDDLEALRARLKRDRRWDLAIE
jgi:flagellar biosynthesis/type III secretory pathway protein FliH